MDSSAHPSRSYSNPSEKALIVGVYRSKRVRASQETSLEELASLAETAGAEVVAREFCELRAVQPATFLGKGKILEIASKIKELGCNLFIFDEDLSPTQARNLEKELQVKVIDRTGLILDIFALRARSKEGKVQVELAQLRYLLSRLTGRGEEFSQLAGGIGTRGPGETRLEMDRRKIKDRISLLSKQLKQVQSHRELHRSRRTEATIATVAIVGYTNAGKSTLMNRLTNAAVLVENKLFATLDPTVRRLKLPSGREILLSDTVGFVRKLPHQLVEAFRATFEEVAAADLLLHLIDLSHPHVADQLATVEKVLEELGLHRRPCLRVFNKIDCLKDGSPLPLEETDILVSALTGQGMANLLAAIDQKLAESYRLLSLRIPHDAGADLSRLYRTGRILKREDRADGIHLQVEVDPKNFNRFRRYTT